MIASTLRRTTALLVILSLIWAAVLGLNLLPMLRGDFGWRWPYAFPPEHPERLALLALALITYLLVAWMLLRQPRRMLILAWSLIGTLALTLAVLFVSEDRPGYELYTRTISPLTTGWHYAAVEIDEQGGLLTVLRDWPAFMHSFEGRGTHITTTPPGLVILYYASGSLLDSLGVDRIADPLRAAQCHDFRTANASDGRLVSAWIGMLTPLWAALAAIPLYELGRRAFDEPTAQISALLWPLIPALLMFTPHPATAYPLLALGSIWLLVAGIDRRPILIVLSGVLVSLMTFINLTALPLIFMAGLLTLLITWHRRAAWIQAVITGAWFGAGLISVWAVYYAVAGVSPFAILAAGMGEHLSLDRPYLPWLWFALNDYGMFTGWPLLILAILASVQAFRAQRSPGALIGFSALITVLLMDVAGVTRGESGRIWLFLTPFLLLSAVHLVRSDAPSLALFSAGQAAMVLALVAFVHVIDSGLSDPPYRPDPPTEAAPKPMLPPQGHNLPVQAIFGPIRFSDFAGRIETRGDEQVLVLWLNWFSFAQVDRTYYLAITPVAPDGVAQQATLIQPFEGQYPTTCWVPSSGLLRDHIEIPLQASGAAGDWWVSLAMVDGDTGEALPVFLADGSEDRQVGIGPFRSAEE